MDLDSSRYPNRLVKLAVSYIILEILWFSYSIPRLYTPFFAKVQGSPVEYRFVFAPIAYILLIGVMYRFIFQGRGSDTRAGVSVNASLLALGIYGVYNLTNLATLSRYDIWSALVDTAWGLVVFNAVAQISF